MGIDPLDELFPALRQPAEEIPDRPVHPRVLVRPRDEGVELMVLVWRDPGGVGELHAALMEIVEATLLSELSRPPTHTLEVHPATFRLLVFDAIDEVERGVEAFGFRPEPCPPDAMAFARGEAQRMGRELEEAPQASFVAHFVSTKLANACEARLVQALESDVFGRRPGAFFAALNIALEIEGAPPLTPRASSLDALESCLVPTRADVLRWIPSLTFQALCDAIAVVAAAELGRDVQWGESVPDEHGVASPPMIRVASEEGWIHVDVGLEVMRWCVMPRRDGEDIPSLSEWLSDRIG